MTDLIITWPKTRPLEDYLERLEISRWEGKVINFRVARAPRVEEGDRCYVVYSGFVRGWSRILGVEHKSDVIDPVSGDFWPEGIYVVREPKLHLLSETRPMRGFQGYRYVTEKMRLK